MKIYKSKNRLLDSLVQDIVQKFDLKHYTIPDQSAVSECIVRWYFGYLDDQTRNELGEWFKKNKMRIDADIAKKNGLVLHNMTSRKHINALKPEYKLYLAVADVVQGLILLDSNDTNRELFDNTPYIVFN